MDKLNKDFVDKVIERFKTLHNIDESKESSINMHLAKISAEIFAISFNTLIRDGHFHELQNEASEE